MKEEYLTPEYQRAYQKRHYRENREEICKRQKEYRRKNAEKISEYQKRYAMTHDRSEYFREYHRKRRAQKIKGEE